MKVLLVIPGTGSGQDMIFCRRQADSLRALGAEVKVFFLSSRVSPLKIFRERLRLRKEIAEFSPDVVHAHYGTVTAWLVVNSTKLPTVITFHGSDINPVPSGARLRTMLSHSLSHLAARKASRIICVSREILGRLIWGREKATVIPMGCSTDIFRPIPRPEARKVLGWNHADPVCLFNGAREDVKRLDLAMAAYSVARKKYPAIRIEVLKGDINPDQIPIYMNASDLLLLTSDFEGSPTMVKEALSCGLPVVSVDVGDVRERLLDVSPSKIAARSPQELGEAIVEVLSANRRSNGRDIALRDLDDAVIARRVLDVYSTLLAKL